MGVAKASSSNFSIAELYMMSSAGNVTAHAFEVDRQDNKFHPLLNPPPPEGEEDSGLSSDFGAQLRIVGGIRGLGIGG